MGPDQDPRDAKRHAGHVLALARLRATAGTAATRDRTARVETLLVCPYPLLYRIVECCKAVALDKAVRLDR
eukprot:505508-Prymnesium_polylepis.1